jgi:uncharacterized protein YecE (DUF72 family)
MTLPVRIGCSGWSYRDWRAEFYPAGLPSGRWLEHYARTFDTVEVNSTFYRLVDPATVAGWVEMTPPGFLFSVKASRFLTHMKRLTDMETGVGRFYERIEPLLEAGKLGPVLWQLPASFRRDDDRLASALGRLPPGRHAFEFRHPSWFVPDVYEALRAHGAALAIAHSPERPFQTFTLTADWTYLRFHHGERGRGGNYSRSELEDWARTIEDFRGRAEVLGYFNNDWKGYAVRNARWLNRRFATEAAPA